jgi:DNA-binding NarL/FixJ family response regulator
MNRAEKDAVAALFYRPSCRGKPSLKVPRIVLADDHPMVLEGVAKLVEEFGEIVGRVEDGRTLVETALRLNPDVVVMDISMPGLSGLEAARALHKLVPQCHIVFLTMHADFLYVSAAFEAGASGYVLKRSAASELKKAVTTVLAGRHYLTPLVLPKDGSLQEFRGRETPKVKPLTPLQREVLQLIAEGHSSKTIASLLHISSKTVEFHKSKIMETLGMHTIPELTRYAFAHGLIGK